MYFEIFTVRGTKEICLFSFVIVCHAVVQFLSAVRTVEQSRKRTDNSAFGRSVAVLPEFLYQLKYRSLDNGRAGIREDFPFFLRSFNLCFVLERLCRTSEIDRISTVFLLGKNIRNRSGTPVVWDNGRFTARLPAHHHETSDSTRQLFFLTVYS